MSHAMLNMHPFSVDRLLRSYYSNPTWEFKRASVHLFNQHHASHSAHFVFVPIRFVYLMYFRDV